MDISKTKTVRDFFKNLAGQAVTLHLINGETISGVVVDLDAGDLLVRQTGYQDLVLIPRHGLAALSAGTGQAPAGMTATSTPQGGGEALPRE